MGNRLHKQVGPWCLECCLQLPSWGPNLLKYQWKLDFGVMELLGAFPLAKLCWDGCCLDDLDAWKPHPVTRGHLIVHILYCTIQSCVSVLLVHIVITSSTLVSQPNPIIIYLSWILLKNLQLEYYLECAEFFQMPPNQRVDQETQLNTNARTSMQILLHNHNKHPSIKFFFSSLATKKKLLRQKSKCFEPYILIITKTNSLSILPTFSLLIINPNKL